MTFEQIGLLIVLAPAAYIVGHGITRYLWREWLACWFVKPEPPRAFASPASNVQTRFAQGPSGAPRVGSRADRYPRAQPVGICPRQLGLRIHAPITSPPRRWSG
jgi:hypothetical protein